MMNAYIYIYICIHIHMYIYVYMYMYIYTHIQAEASLTDLTNNQRKLFIYCRTKGNDDDVYLEYYSGKGFHINYTCLHVLRKTHRLVHLCLLLIPY
jgi:hypothetical protein